MHQIFLFEILEDVYVELISTAKKMVHWELHQHLLLSSHGALGANLFRKVK